MYLINTCRVSYVILIAIKLVNAFCRYLVENGGPGSDKVPRCESLSMVIDRLMPYWRDTIVPRIGEGKRVLIVAHGSSLRGVIKHLEGLTDAQAWLLLPIKYVVTFKPLIWKLSKKRRADVPECCPREYQLIFLQSSYCSKYVVFE